MREMKMRHQTARMEIARHDNGGKDNAGKVLAYLMLKVRQRCHTRLQFLRAVSHCVDAHNNRLTVCDADDDSSDVDDDDADHADVVKPDSPDQNWMVALSSS